ncbi:MAG: hypothetical protein EOM08_12870 [Clostridia bacterium]|nr:hypothetical protein [Clostridia bacterium]
MKQELEQKIQKILASNFETPSIFKTVLKKELAITEKEEIIDIVNIQREYADAVKKTQIYSPAVLLIATTYGLIVVEEGQTALELDYGGYRIRHIMYSKIQCLEFDTCLLLGVFKLVLGTGNEPDLLIEFNTARNYYEFEALVDNVRRKMVENERALHA